MQFPQKEQPITFLFIATMMLNLDSIGLHGGARLVTIIDDDDYYSNDDYDDGDYYSDDDYDDGCL